MKMGGSMHDTTGWTEVDCKQSDQTRGAQPVSPSSSLTDLVGEYGPAVQYTEWTDADGRPVLRDYVWSPLNADRRCEHLVPKESLR